MLSVSIFVGAPDFIRVATSRSASKLRMRFRLGEKGHWPLDPLIYLEYKDNAAFDHSALETKLILARDFEKLNVSLNPVLEFEFDEE